MNLIYILLILPSFSLEINNNEWMNECWNHLHNLTLSDIAIPGSHDSAAYWLGDSYDPDAGWVHDMAALAERVNLPIPNIVRPWAIAQNTILKQLQSGIRYLDMRAQWNGSQWVGYHFLEGLPFIDLLIQIKDFLINTDKEIIVMDVNHVDDGVFKSDIGDLLKCITSYLGPWIVNKISFPTPFSTPFEKWPEPLSFSMTQILF
eukprot:GHVL01004609.1.p1 GENE.GHVL01004609.1~~GHVL01004609.1.p1  ORF type:complete len:219 (+),score=32.26 GHVL01004609.1:48-659(+)